MHVHIYIERSSNLLSSYVALDSWQAQGTVRLREFRISNAVGLGPDGPAILCITCFSLPKNSGSHVRSQGSFRQCSPVCGSSHRPPQVKESNRQEYRQGVKRDAYSNLEDHGSINDPYSPDRKKRMVCCAWVRKGSCGCWRRTTLVLRASSFTRCVRASLGLKVH